tara:strand:- start:50191 stop:51558 length:1368 start_codon:yes stop_codon:yes gene_type:complete
MPYIQPSQAQKHVTHNEALRLLDAIVQLVVLTDDQNSPPVTPEEGGCYLVAEHGQAAWAGQDQNIAIFSDAAWQFIIPKEGWVAQVTGKDSEVVFDGTVWTSRRLGNLAGLGIGADYDAYNRLVVSADAVLLNNAGASHQVKVNKATGGDTASLVFQTGFSGRAELGLVNNDDFALKVSSDGVNWTEALRVDGLTGRVTTGVAGWREVLTGPRSFFVDAILGNDAGSGMGQASDAFASLPRALAAALSLDSGGHDVTIEIASGIYGLAETLRIGTGLTGGGKLILQGNSADPDAATIEATDSVIEVSSGYLLLRGVRLQNSSTVKAVVTVATQGEVILDQVAFGPAGGHLNVAGGRVALAGGYAIKGSAAYHLRVSEGGLYDGSAQSVVLQDTPSFSDTYITCSEGSVARVTGQGFTGNAAGKRFDLSTNGIIIARGNTLPGDTAGTTQTGGQYV